jgi:hypothetical protein
VAAVPEVPLHELNKKGKEKRVIKRGIVRKEKGTNKPERDETEERFIK